MYSLSKKAQIVKKKLAIFDRQPSDYEAVMKSLPSVISLIEEMESMAVTCRKIIAAYQKELPLYTGLSDKKKQKISLSNIFRIGSLSNRYLTEISLMKQEDFLLWFEKNRHTKME